MMQASPVVSILIPTYNRAAYLRKAIRSALSQTYSAIEVLVLDDASPDDTSVIVAEFCSDARVKYIRHERNLGIAGNWRSGITAAQGEFFCILHDDDTFEASFVEQVLQPLLTDGNLILAFSDHWIMSTEGRRLPEASDEGSIRFRRSALPSGVLMDFAQSALIDMSIPVGATMFRRSLVDPDCLAEEAQGAIDIWLFYQCVKTGRKAYYVPARLMNYRGHGDGMSRSKSMRPYGLEGQLFRQRRIVQDSQLEAIHPAVRQQISWTLMHLGAATLRQGKTQKARDLIKESFSCGFTLRKLMVYGLTCSGRLGVRAAEAMDLR